MDIEYYSKNDDKENDDFFLQVRPSVYYNSEGLINRMINLGCKYSSNDIRNIIDSLKGTVLSIMKEGGMVTIDDFVSFTPSLMYKSKSSKNIKIDKDKLTLCVKASIPVSFCEAIAMEVNFKEIPNKQENK